jgi:putative DNA primase/helicase
MKDQPFRILGIDEECKNIFYQNTKSGQVGSIAIAFNNRSLCALAPNLWWMEQPRFRVKDDLNYSAIADELVAKAREKGIFDKGEMRGPGAWLEDGKVVYHLGESIWVDGKVKPLGEHEGSAQYRLAKAVLFAERFKGLKPLTDEEGLQVWRTLNEAGHEGLHGGTHLLGWIVAAAVGGALQVRPPLQLSGQRSSGKSATKDGIIIPLLAGVPFSFTAATEAGVRQQLEGSSHPVLIDESEQEDQRKREGHVRLCRYSFDGCEVPRGTSSGNGLSYRIESSIALLGINTPIENPADRSRFVRLTRKRLSGEAWEKHAIERSRIITVETGEKLLLRVLENFATFQANIAALEAVIARKYPGDNDSRNGQVYGTLLGGVRLLTSTVALDEDTAAAWLGKIGWDLTIDVEEHLDDADSEPQQCLEYLLAYRVRWNKDNTGEMTVRELLEQAGRSGDTTAFADALAREGLKLHDVSYLAVSHKTGIFAGSKWAGGAHRGHLRQLPGATLIDPSRFGNSPTQRATLLPKTTWQG